MSCGRILENDDDGAQLIPQVSPATQDSRCCRCQSQAVDVLIRNTPWCRACFSSQLTNKFAQGLRPAKEYCRPPKGEAKSVENHGSLVVHYSNTPACLILLDLLKKYIQANDDRSTVKWQSPADFSAIEVVCVSMGSGHVYFASNTNQELDIAGACLLASSHEEARIRAIVEGFGFKFVLLDLDDLFSNNEAFAETNYRLVNLGDTNLPSEISACISDKTAPSTPLCRFLGPLTPTSRVTALSHLVFSSLVRFCGINITPGKRKKVLLESTTATSMAIDTLVSVSSGGGWGIDETIGGTAVLDDVFICRPLSQMVDAEIGHQVLLSELPPHLHSATTFVSATTSRKHTIPSLITDFLTKLEDGYPMTSSVINRAANKIGHRAPNNQESAGTEASYRICPTCRLPSDPRANSWKKSITLASHASKPHQVTSTLHEEPIKLSDHLCYSCLGTFRDRSQFSTLSTDQEVWTQFPDYVMKSVEQQGPNRGAGKYEEMRKMIEGFLIDPDTE